jgi:hypothetical protein
VRRKRKRQFQVTCRCSAYKFPHRIGGGRCNGSAWAECYHIYVQDDCAFCNHNNNGTCEVWTGQEPIKECQAFEAAMFNEVDPKLPAEEFEIIERIYGCEEDRYGPEEY